MTDKEKRIRSLNARRSVVAPEDIDGAFPPITTARFPNDHVNGLLETRMDNGRKAFVKTDGRSSDQTASSADDSGKKLAHKSENIIVALHVKHVRNRVRRTS